jgi:hypothetical protein
MTVLLEKYGSLYPKRFHKYRWQYIWYKKFWWKPWDTKFKEVQKRCLESTAIASWSEQPVPFTEEVLLEDYLKYLDKNFPFAVRPRADKALWKAKKTWIADSVETWEKKAWDMPTAAERINYALTLLPWEEAEFLWALRKVFPKHGSAAEMHALPFILTASWLAKDFDPALIWMLKTLAFTTSYTELALNSTEEWIRKYQKFIVEAARLKLWDKKAKELENAIWIWNKEKRIKALRNFWDEYWIKLIETLTGNDWFILQETEKWNDIVRAYVDTHDKVVNDNDYWPKDDDLNSEFPQNAWINSYVWWLLSRLTWDIITEKYTSKVIFYSYVDILKSIKNMKDNNWDPLDEETKKRIFKKIYSRFEWRIMQVLFRTIGQIWRWDRSALEKQIPVLAELKSFWLIYFKWDEDERKTEKYNDFLEEAWNNFKNFNSIWVENNTESRPDLSKIMDNIAVQAWNTVNNPSYSWEEENSWEKEKVA